MNIPSEYILFGGAIVVSVIGWFLKDVTSDVKSHDTLLGLHNNELIKIMAEIKALENSTKIEHGHFVEMVNSKFDNLEKSLGDLNINIKQLNSTLQGIKEDNAVLKAKYQKQ